MPVLLDQVYTYPHLALTTAEKVECTHFRGLGVLFNHCARAFQRRCWTPRGAQRKNKIFVIQIVCQAYSRDRRTDQKFSWEHDYNLQPPHLFPIFS